MNVWDILILAILGVFVAVALWILVRDKKNGKGCCGTCSDCSRSCNGKKHKK